MRLANIKVQFTAVYGKHNRDDRQSRWELLKITGPCHNLPWLVSVVCGDFNEIRSPEERVSRGISTGLLEFINATNTAQIMEMPSIGRGIYMVQ